MFLLFDLFINLSIQLKSPNLFNNFFTDNPLHTDTAKASMDNPIPINNISILDIFTPQLEYNLPLQPHNAYWMQSVH